MKIKNSTVLTLLAPALVAARHYRRRTAFAEITRTEASNCGVLSEMAALINSSDCGINLCFKDGTTMSPTQAPGNSSTTTTTTKGTTTTTTTATGTTTTTTKATTTTTTTKASATPTTPSAIHVGTYLPNWFVYKKLYMGMSKLNVQGAAASESDLVSTYNYWAQDLVGLAPKLTHLYYAFWDVGKDCKVVDRDPDASWYGKGPSEPTWIEKKGKCAGLMNDMMALKSQFPHLKLLISLGGWTYSQNFSTCASTVANREMLWRTTNYRLNEMDANWAKPGAIWDGIDFDWEFPGVSEGLAPSDSSVIWYRDEDWKNYVLLATLFRDSAKSAGRTQIELTTAIGVGTSLRNLANDPATAVAFCNIMDGVNLMEYDIHGKWDPTTGHNAPFCYDTRDGNPSMAWNVKETVDSLIAAGCPPAKLILGLPNYSHAWTRIPAGPDGNGLFQKATDTSYYQDAQGNEFGKWVGWSSFSDGDSQWVPQGIVSYWDLKDELAKNSDLKVFSWDCPIDEGIVVPIKHVYSATKQAFASYEDPDTIQKKTQWAKSKGLGGFFFWDAQQDRKGDILDAAIQGFGGLPTNPASGTAKCFDGNKPDFDVDPDTGKPIVFECKSGGTKYVVVSGDTCFGLKTKLGSSCSDGTPALQASYRAGETECKQVCSEDFTGAGKDDMWLGDEIYYKC